MSTRTWCRSSRSAQSQLELNQWALSGDWTVGEQITTLNEPGGRMVHRFHGRDLNLVLGSRAGGGPTRFLVLIDGEPPNRARGLDVDERGNGTVSEERLYQLIRQGRPITERTFEITFIDAGPGLRVHLRVVVVRVEQPLEP
jgi:thioredoxin family protein